MKKQVIGLSVLLIMALIGQVNSPLLAQESPVNVKIGYFSLGMVKANFPLAASSEILKAQAESQLRQEAKTLNETLQKMKEAKKPDVEIKKHVEVSQTKISAKQQALAQLLQTQSQTVRLSIQQAVNAVAKEKGLDIVVDGQAIYAGGQRFLDKGVDITKDVIAKLQPGAQTTRRAAPRKAATPTPAPKSSQ